MSFICSKGRDHIQTVDGKLMARDHKQYIGDMLHLGKTICTQKAFDTVYTNVRTKASVCFNEISEISAQQKSIVVRPQLAYNQSEIL